MPFAPALLLLQEGRSSQGKVPCSADRHRRLSVRHTVAALLVALVVVLAVAAQDTPMSARILIQSSSAADLSLVTVEVQRQTFVMIGSLCYRC